MSRKKTPVVNRKESKSARTPFLRNLWLPAVLMLAIAAGGLTGLVVAYQLNNSQAAANVASLATYRPSVVTRVYADDGETVIGEFALERRIPIGYEEIPPVVRHAILAVEDARFNEHIGIDPIRILGAAYKNITTGTREGGSTLTQQLAKNLFLSKEQTFERKFKEMMLALQIERFYTKEQILEMYANHIFLGANSYGIEAGAETYFGKGAKELTIDEAALLAGIPKAPSRYSPTANPELARERRDLVIELMARNEFISREEAERAKARPIKLLDTAYYPPRYRSTPFDYPVEEVRQYLEQKYTTRVAHSGLRVYTTINVGAQETAYKAVREGLRWYDRTHSRWRSDYRNIASEFEEGLTARKLKGYQHPHWYGNDYREGRYVMGLVMEVDEKSNEAEVRFGSYTATVTSKEMGRSRAEPSEEFETGDLAEFKIEEVDDEARRLKVELSQIPAVQGALMTLNAKTGEVVTMIGGYDFTTNKFNNATQANRQTGSVFKPFIYTAAIEWGMTPDTKVSGAPIVKNDGFTVWRPHNYDGSTGSRDLPMRTALAKSMNVQAVHLMDEVGIQSAAQMVRRFGISAPMAPYLPSALGATEVPLDEMVSAYSVFPNKGVRVQPHLIRRVLDRDGNVLEEWERASNRVVSEYVALTMVDMMRDVVERGTAVRARAVGRPLAGKTGTVNDHTDVWFIGYTPTYVTGVWMGYSENKRSLGRDMTGSRGALPIFVDFMKEFLEDKEREDFEKPPKMPSELRELYELRQRQMAEERALMASRAARRSPVETMPELDLELELEPVEVPPVRTIMVERLPDSPPVVRPRTVDASVDEPPPPIRSREPREPVRPRKRGKRGDVDPPGASGSRSRPGREPGRGDDGGSP